MSAAALFAGHAPPDRTAVWERAADVCGALEAARETTEGAALRDLFADAPVAGEAAIVRYSEIDPIHIPSCMTADAIALPVARAAAADGAAFVEAVWIAGAVGVRLARAVGGIAALKAGVWPALFAAPAVAAVADAIARRRPDEVVQTALILALSGTSGRAGRPQGMPSGRWVVFGQAVAGGLGAARAARAGATGDPGLISAEWLAAQSPGLADTTALDGHPRDTAVGLKPYVAARQGTTALAAFRNWICAGGDPQAITSIEVALPPLCLPVVSQPVQPAIRLSKIANLPFALGLAATDSRNLLDIARDGPPPSAALDFAGRVTLTADESLAADEGLWPARLTIETNRGTEKVRLDQMPGDPGAEGRPEMLRSKLAALGARAALAALDAAHTGDDDAALDLLRAEETRITAAAATG